MSFRQDMAHWHRMLKLLKNSDEDFGNLKMKVLNNIGDDYASQCNWQAAVKYYERAENMEKLIECYSHMDNYEALKKIMEKLPEKHSLLEKIAKKFAAEGVFPQLVEAYEKVREMVHCSTSWSVVRTNKKNRQFLVSICGG